MEKKEWNLIKDSEELKENELSEIEGGEDSDEDCSCDCYIGNKNTGGGY